MIFFFPFCSRKISSTISRRTVEKNCLKILELSVQVWDANRTKFCSQKKPWKFYIWAVLDNHCWPRFDSQDWLSGSPTDFSSGCFCWTRDQKILSRELKNSRIFFEYAFFREKRSTNIGKSWSNKYHPKISGKIRLCLKKWILKNIDQNSLTFY